MRSGPTWLTPGGFLITATESVFTSTSVEALGDSVSYSLVSGGLPSGLTISSAGVISGSPAPVLNTTSYNFVIRARSLDGVSDRGFSINVEGAQAPTWSTSSGYSSQIDYDPEIAYLKLGPEGENFALDKQWVSYQFSASPTNAPPGTGLTYYISENGGELPPGLTLSQTGVLSGFLNDNLIFDGTRPDTGGYDEELYDKYSYDFGLVAEDSIGVPKIYQFRVTASDGVRSSDRFFKILVVSPYMIRNPERVQMTLEPGILNTNSNYLPPLQFVRSSDLGVARSENNETFDVSAYNGYPSLGTVEYSVVYSDNRLEQLPDFMSLDTESGTIYGYIPYQPAYTENYQFTITATRSYNLSTVESSAAFSLGIKGLVETTIEWISEADLGILYTGITSEIAVVARQTSSDYTIKYTQTSGTIPPGLTLERDGSLSGTVEYETSGTFVFGVKAEDVYGLSAIEREFTLTIVDHSEKKYTRMWVRPFLPLEQRETYRNFLTDEFTFPQSSMYRFFDPNFGVQSDIKIILEFGIERRNLDEYVPALRENFYRRSFYFGDVKVAVAKDSTGKIIYEVIYVDVVDDIITQDGRSADLVIQTSNATYYPNSITNMQNRLEHLTLNNIDFIDTDNLRLPTFMKTAQANEYKPAGYMAVIPLCYALPGESSKILSRIKLSKFDFKQFHLDIDRLIVGETLDNPNTKYLLFPRQTITNTLDSDSTIYVFDGTPLETDQGIPIERK